MTTALHNLMPINTNQANTQAQNIETTLPIFAH